MARIVFEHFTKDEMTRYVLKGDEMSQFTMDLTVLRKT